MSDEINKIEQKEIPEGEIFIQDFLKMIGIKYEFQPKIEGLKNDVKKWRVADFYLPEYNIYIELLGLWNKGTEQNNIDIITKKRVYKENNIRCVYLYYENLGFLYHALDQRMIKCFKENNMLKELNKYRKFKFKKTIPLNIILLFISLLIVAGNLFTNENGGDINIYLLFGSIFIYQAYRIYHYYDLIFKKDRFSLFHQFIDK